MQTPTTPPLSGHDEAVRNAYNAVFCQLELDWHWDTATYRSLLACADDRERLRTYVEQHCPHLLRAYPAEHLVDAIESVRGGLSRY
jgi:hypothetical protein